MIFNPSIVSLLNIIILFWAALKPFRCSTLFPTLLSIQETHSQATIYTNNIIIASYVIELYDHMHIQLYAWALLYTHYYRYVASYSNCINFNYDSVLLLIYFLHQIVCKVPSLVSFCKFLLQDIWCSSYQKIYQKFSQIFVSPLCQHLHNKQMHQQLIY